MDKKNIAWIKSTFPGLFSRAVKSFWLMRCVTKLDFGRYTFSKIKGRPYFGSMYLAGQTWEERKAPMAALIALECRRRKLEHFSLLEVGSWAGNSAIFWAQLIQRERITPRIVCVDAWLSYIDPTDQDEVNVATRLMDHDLRRGRILRLFLHNVRSAGFEDCIHAFKGKSDDVLPFLKQASFDLIYIDGDHRYSQFMRDLVHAAGLLKVGGVLCGDDYDATLERIDLAHAQAHKERNVTIDPKTKLAYHPGVVLALHEFLGKNFSSFAGFWLSRRREWGWEKIDLSSDIAIGVKAEC